MASYIKYHLLFSPELLNNGFPLGQIVTDIKLQYNYYLNMDVHCELLLKLKLNSTLLCRVQPSNKLLHPFLIV